MSIAKCYSAHLVGLNLEIITVEVDISNGLNAVSIVGLGDRAIEEAKDRVSAAIKNCGFTSPKQKNQKVVISLAPADVRKEGPVFDLAIAVAYLCAAGDIEFDSENTLFLGELSLEGHLRKVSGVLPILCQATKAGFTRVFIPQSNEEEASLASRLDTFAVSSLAQVIRHFSGFEPLHSIPKKSFDELLAASLQKNMATLSQDGPDMHTIRGNETAKRGLEIAAAGAHNILMFGPPGTGKTMLAQCFSSILPPLSHREAIEVTGIHSAARIFGQTLISSPPFRSPHHTASYPAVVGGGIIPKPGEITLAHRGVLFLDEFPEFSREVIEALRQPLEERTITIARARGVVTFPAQCILIASMNPCPCGKSRDTGCTCSESTILTYRRRVSGPIMDRLDISVNVSKIDYDKLSAKTSDAEYSKDIRERVIAARALARQRFARIDSDKKYNSEMDAKDIEKMMIMTEGARRQLTNIAKKAALSGRGFHRIIKVARTIADLGDREIIEEAQILEAFQYRHKTGDIC